MDEINKKRINRIRKLEKFYLNNLVEDPQDGTPFDCMVYDKIDEMIELVEKLKKIFFITRHEATPAQIATLQEMGYELEGTVNIVFSELKNPVETLEENNIGSKTIAIVAPSYINMRLLNHGYTLIEFVNAPEKREKMVFVCKGAFQYKLKCVPKDYAGNEFDAYIDIIYTECPIDIEKQIEVALYPPKNGSD